MAKPKQAQAAPETTTLTRPHPNDYRDWCECGALASIMTGGKWRCRECWDRANAAKPYRSKATGTLPEIQTSARTVADLTARIIEGRDDLA